ncbi:MAG: hypothetical protein E7588_03820 [Ruminococcaceae bacterium]|nr:hypothetical protein [Oscillospiraceae bacterium]
MSITSANQKRKRRRGDRADGRLLRTVSPMSLVALYIMKERNDASNMYTEALEIKEMEKYIMQKRKDGMKGLGILHVVIAAYIRTVAKYPGINRFISGQRIYARNNVQTMLTIKKVLDVNAPDTVIKLTFQPNADINTVYNAFTQEIAKNKDMSEESDFDKTAAILMKLPRLILRFVVGFLKFLDYFGMLPKFLMEVSPFHGSFFITSMGSLGIPAIFHHLYNFGNVPIFCSFGAKRTDYATGPLGLPIEKKFVDFSYVLDERICDGHYYATAFKYMREILKNPSVLDQAPEIVNEDIE